MPTPELLRTAEVLERTGISHQVLYRYITLGLIEPARTTAGGQRLFHPNVIPLIDIIKSITSEGGYSLRDLKDIFFKDERVRRLSGEAVPAQRPEGKPSAGKAPS